MTMKKIFVECFADEALIKAMDVPKRFIEHAKSKGNVCNKLRKNFSCVGLIDEDPQSNQPRYLDGLKSVKEREGLKIKKDLSNDNLLIIFSPRLEDWIKMASKSDGIDLSEFGLSDDPDKLHREINLHINKFERFLISFKEKSRRFKTLKDLIT